MGVEYNEAVGPADMPAHSAELVLMRVYMEAFLSTAHIKPRLRARAFLTLVTEILATEESVSRTFPIRPTADTAAVQRSRRQAIAVYRQCLPLFLARVPREDAAQRI